MRRKAPQLAAVERRPDYKLDQLEQFGLHLHERERDGRTVRVRLIEELLRIRDKSGQLIPLVPNRAQQEFERGAEAQNIVLKARQVGISTWVAARFFIATITRPGTVSVQVAHDLAAAQQIFRIVHRFVANLPGAMRKGALATSRANVRQLVFPALDSEYRVETAADREAGRGLTITNLHASEVARWPGDPAETLAGLRAAVAPQGETVLESTPNGAGGCFYDEWQRAPETGMVQHFFPWWYEESYVRDAGDVGELAPDERDLMERCNLAREQIAYRREMRANFRALAPQEYVEDARECFLASGDCVFDMELVEQRLRECLPPLRTSDNDRLRVWYPPLRDREYIIGVDPAGGGPRGDYACAQVIDRKTGVQCAELHGHYPPRELAAKVAELGRQYNGALVAVERNNHGHAVLIALEDLQNYEHLYGDRKGSGWETNAATRPRLIEHLVAVFTAGPELFLSERFLAECRTFVRRADGSPTGEHDDTILALAIAHQVRELTVGRRPPVREVEQPERVCGNAARLL